ncbi:hypothetical protein [Mycolicibacterium mengxianglii]|uniref:hypothetical protein n=1 Tax=Mycolicibacterium mengxianglii TaxID=2736649 RepID=UPI0018D1B375|nr:hypothetical protein [Mycolicibacterium mengxianglii]
MPAVTGQQVAEFLGQGDNSEAVALAGAAMTPNAGGVAPAAGTGGGFAGMSGLPMEGAMMAAGMANLIIPGAGAGAQMAMKLGNRAIAQIGRYAGIGVSGFLETVLPAGSELAGKSWLTRLAGGLSGARPALPNMAGGA